MLSKALTSVVRQRELGVRKPHRSLLRKQRRWPNSQACCNRGDYRRCRSRDWGELRLRNGCDHRSHDEIAWNIGTVVQRRPYVSQHGCAGERRCDCATFEIALCRDQQMVVLTFSQTSFKPPGKVCGRLDRRKVSEEKKRSADLRIVGRAALTLSKMPLHANQLYPGKSVVYESNVLITKLATIHVDRLRVR
jgi:hypothetical protein